MSKVGRHQKGTIDWFPHDVHNDGKTIFTLERKFGNDGYAFWFKLLEVLGDTEGLVFDYNNSANREFLLAKTITSEEKATEILNTLSNLGAIDEELWQEKVIWIQKLVDRVENTFKRRECELPQKPNLCQQELPTTEFMSTEKPLEPNFSSIIGQYSTVHNSTLNTSCCTSEKKDGNEATQEEVDTPKFPEDSQPYRLTNLLFDLMLGNNPKARIPNNRQKEMVHIDRMIRLDKREPADIERVICWCQADDFWKTNILSTTKLREQFDQLWLKMNVTIRGSPKRKHGQIEHGDEWKKAVDQVR